MDIWYFSEFVAPEQLSHIHSLPEQGFVWLDFKPNEVESAVSTIEQLTGTSLHERHVHDCLNVQHPCFYDSMQNYDFIIFRDIKKFSTYTAHIETVPIVLILFENLLVTIDYGQNITNQIKIRLQESGRRYPTQIKALVHTLLNAVVDDYMALRTPLSQQFLYWQGRLLDDNKRFNDWFALMDFKTNIRQLESLCEEQLDTLEQWREDMGIQISDYIAVRVNDLSNHIMRMLRFSKKITDELNGLMQLHYSLLSHRTNEVMRVLTVISATFLPLMLITGVFGMNFVHMPILQTPWGYYVTLSAMVALVVILLWIFRYKKWI